MKTLVLLSSGVSWSTIGEAERREELKEMPRISPFVRTLNGEVLNEQFLKSAPKRRQIVYARVPVSLAQVMEAYAVRKRYDAVVSWAEHLGIPFAGLLKATGAHTPHVTIFSWISKWKKAVLLKRVISHIDKMILMSTAQRNFATDVLGISPSRIALLRWPVDLQFWRPEPGAGSMICSAGREMRDYGTLIDAVRGLEIPCHIAEGGQLQMEKNDLGAKAIREAGSLPQHITVGRKSFPELRQLYAQSRFLVMPLLPTDTDNGNTSMLEAMAMRKPVICSRVSGQRDVVQEGKTGLFVPPGDPRALRNAIQFLWDNPEITERMGKDARAYVERYHDFDNWTTDVRNVVESVTGKHERERKVETDSAELIASSTHEES
ncbi:MAG: glycosyltransferase family 4 protein [Ignavibacteria bacterium]|nr:glycosyltransferase family 4 protein [Ignavibacteria bacterium]